MKGRLESGEAVKDRHVMRRRSEHVEIQRLVAMHGELEERTGMCLRQPTIDRRRIDERMLPPNARPNVDERQREQEWRNPASSKHRRARRRPPVKPDVRDHRPARGNARRTKRLELVKKERMKKRVHAEGADDADDDP